MKVFNGGGNRWSFCASDLLRKWDYNEAIGCYVAYQLENYSKVMQLKKPKKYFSALMDIRPDFYANIEINWKLQKIELV